MLMLWIGEYDSRNVYFAIYISYKDMNLTILWVEYIVKLTESRYIWKGIPKSSGYGIVFS